MKKINLIALISMLFIINACIKKTNTTPESELYYKGKIYSVVDSLPKLNTKFKLWEAYSGGTSGIKYNISYFTTDNEGKFCISIKKSNSFYVTKENEVSLDYIFVSNINYLIGDTAYIKDVYYTP